MNFKWFILKLKVVPTGMQWHIVYMWCGCCNIKFKVGFLCVTGEGVVLFVSESNEESGMKVKMTTEASEQKVVCLRDEKEENGW